MSFKVKLLLVIWIVIISFGIYFFILAFARVSIIWTVLLANPIALLSYVFMIFPAGNVFLTVRGLIEKKKWIEPRKFLKGVFAQLVVSVIVSLLTMVFFGASNFADNPAMEFFILVPLFTFLFTVVFFTIYGLYSFFNEV